MGWEWGRRPSASPVSEIQAYLAVRTMIHSKSHKALFFPILMSIESLVIVCSLRKLGWSATPRTQSFLLSSDTPLVTETVLDRYAILLIHYNLT